MTEAATERFILRGGDRLSQLDAEVAELYALDRVRVLDRSQRMLRVEGDLEQIQGFLDRHPGWTLAREVRYRIPEQRPVAKRS